MTGDRKIIFTIKHSSQDEHTLEVISMSDFEDDEMDVDAPSVKESIQFNSNNTDAKGKRTAANLPVEAEDSLPW